MKRQRGFVNNNKVIGINNKYSQPSIIDAFAVFAVASSLQVWLCGITVDNLEP